MHFYNDINAWELYDLKKDPDQMHNIYGKPGTEKLTKNLKKQLLQLQVQYDDPIRLKLWTLNFEVWTLWFDHKTLNFNF